MAKKAVTLGRNQTHVKGLKIGDIVRINGHDYYFKGVQDVRQNGLNKKQVAFWSVKTEFKKYFDLSLLLHVVTKIADKTYRWSEKE